MNPAKATRRVERDGARFDAPIVVLLVGILGIVLGLAADRRFEAGLGTTMTLLALAMLRDELRSAGSSS